MENQGPGNAPERPAREHVQGRRPPQETNDPVTGTPAAVEGEAPSPQEHPSALVAVDGPRLQAHPCYATYLSQPVDTTTYFAELGSLDLQNYSEFGALGGNWSDVLDVPETERIGWTLL